MAPLDTHRYTLATPAKSKVNDHSAWEKALDNAHAQLEHQHLRCSHNTERAMFQSAEHFVLDLDHCMLYQWYKNGAKIILEF